MSTPNTTPLTYNGYVVQIATMAVVNTTVTAGVVVGVDAAFNDIIPQMLNYSELRIQRDLDLLPLTSSNTYTMPAGNNIFEISTNDFVTIQTITGAPSSGCGGLSPLPLPLLPTTKQFLDNVYGFGSTSGVPLYFAMYGGDYPSGTVYNKMFIGPTPDRNYSVTVTGTVRMPTLYQYSTNPTDANTGTTFISTYYPDLLIMASMIYISAYQRNFGRMSDDPSMAQSYESQYQTLLKGAATEEYRKKFQAAAWSSDSTSPVATPTR
jgi:hypothetical protein